ncbi:MAG: hypothetical protein ABH891_02760 [Candidatus Omnitrophota bacterium]
MLVFLAKLIGLAVAGFGLTIFVSPKFVQKVFNFIKEGKRIYWAGVFRCLVGFLLLLIASKSAVPVATVSVGAVFLLSGIIVFACDLEKLKNFLVHYSEMPVLVIRLLGLVAASFGILIFSIV